MPQYSDFVDRILLQPKLLEKLCPTEPLSYDLLQRVREADDATITGVTEKTAAPEAALIRAGLFYAVDALDPAHRIFQDEKSDLGSYWHGMMHRREADFDNARYWFRRSGRLPFFPKLHRAAGEEWSLANRQPDWDPYLFTGECEQARFGAETGAELAPVQRAEFHAIFDYTWRRVMGQPSNQ
jgi:hypothetical protein